MTSDVQVRVRADARKRVGECVRVREGVERRGCASPSSPLSARGEGEGRRSPLRQCRSCAGENGGENVQDNKGDEFSTDVGEDGEVGGIDRQR